MVQCDPKARFALALDLFSEIIGKCNGSKKNSSGIRISSTGVAKIFYEWVKV